MKTPKSLLFALLTAGLAVSAAAQSAGPSLGPGSNGARYATDAYPGFDDEGDETKPERKEPRWWWWMCGGPDCETAAAQFAHCQDLAGAGSYAAACRQLDALVRQWPTAPEAWKAQQQLAELRLTRMDDAEEAFREFRYLLDFYSLQCDYSAIADRLYQVAGRLKLEGKEVMFVRFANTVDVRRFHEMCVLRAPGAAWVPEAMLTIASLREDEGRNEEAVKVYENLRNIHPDSPEAKRALAREAGARMELFRERGYNRARSQDTINFLKMALDGCLPEDVAGIREMLAEVQAKVEDEAYRAARFYDSPTRTKRSAINAYERFLAEFPQSARADALRARIAELKGAGE